MFDSPFVEFPSVCFCVRKQFQQQTKPLHTYIPTYTTAQQAFGSESYNYMVFIWHPSGLDPDGKCLQYDHGITPEDFEKFGPSNYEEITCLYPWMRPFYFEYVVCSVLWLLAVVVCISLHTHSLILYSFF